MSRETRFFAPTAALAVVLALSLVTPARAQDGDPKKPAGETPKDDPGAKKDDPKPKPAEKPAEAATKTLAFEKPAAWKDGKPASGPVKASYQTDAAEGDAQGATVQVRALGSKGTWESQLDFWASLYEDADGKKLEKGALKTETFDAGGLPTHMVVLGGTFVGRPRRDGDTSKPADKKPGQKTIGCVITGPDGAWSVSIYGAEKSVEKAREDFLKFVKGVKVVEKTGEKPAGSADRPEGKPAKDPSEKDDKKD